MSLSSLHFSRIAFLDIEFLAASFLEGNIDIIILDIILGNYLHMTLKAQAKKQN
jgi:hypothetical protein